MMPRHRNISKSIRTRIARIFIDYNKVPSSSVVLAGRGRSGTTWMANIINYNNDYRLIFEPFRPDMIDMCRHFGSRKYIRPESRDPIFLEPVEAILRGNIRSAWTDSKNKGFLFNKRLIKTVRANLFLKWLKVNFPQVPVVLAIRHPCAVVHSAMRQGWAPAIPKMMAQRELVDDFLDPFIDSINNARNDFEQHVFAWCIEHFIIFQQFQSDEIYLLFYEELYAEPKEEIKGLFDFLSQEYDEHVLEQFYRPSVTTTQCSQRAIVTGKEMSSQWRKHVTANQIDKCLEILGIFGLDQVYTDASRPNKIAALEMIAENTIA